MSNVQKVLLLSKKFGPFVISEVPRYTPGPGEITVKVQSTGLNPADWKIYKYGKFIEEFPAILGCDIAGDVDEVGEGVTEFKKGDKIFTLSRCLNKNRWANEKNSFQQYVVATAADAARIPANISYDQAATIPAGIATAYSGLYAGFPHGAGLSPPGSPDAVGKYVGSPIVILGGSSSVGQ